MGSETDASEHSECSEQLDLPVWNRTAALDRLDGNEALLGELTDMLLEQIAEGIPLMSEAIERNDALGLQRAAHSLKGAAASLSAQRVGQRAGELEIMGRRHDLSRAREALGRLQQEEDLLRAEAPCFR